MRALLVSLTLICCAFAQQTVTPSSLPAFDAASVKPYTFVPGSGARCQGLPRTDPTHFTSCAELRYLILTAYGLDDYQLSPLPDWTTRLQLYLVTATTAAPTTRDQMLLMLRRLLTERFQLKVEESEKEQPVWDLVIATGGPKLKPRDPDEPCPPVFGRDGLKAAGVPPNTAVQFRGCTIKDLARFFNNDFVTIRQLGRPVVDKTGLTGHYLLLVWQTVDRTDADGSYNAFTDEEPFRDAVQQELGLKLVPGNEALRFFNVLNVAPPTPD